MYAGSSAQVTSDKTVGTALTKSTDKVDRVCNAVKAAVEKVDSDRWISSYTSLCACLAC